MRKDQIFVLILVIFLPLTGCFGNSVGEAEADENGEGTTVINNYYNNSTVQTNSQQITYFSSGGIVYQSWYDYGVDANGGLNDSHPLHPSNGGVNATLYSSQEYNLSVCNSRGGFHFGNTSAGSTYNGHTTGRQIMVPTPKYRPVCTIELATINTTSGEALAIHEQSMFWHDSVCEGVKSDSSSGMFEPGAALNCTHTLYYDMNYEYSDDVVFWSIVYSIQPTIVV
jgi:hypothetical protein